MFPTIDYLEWMSGRPEVAMYDLGSSDLAGERTHEPTTAPDALADRSDPPPGATLELQVASAYDVDPGQVLVTAGASHANFLAAAAALGRDGDAEADGEADDASGNGTARALVEKPGYEPLVRTPEALGATVDRFRRGEGYALDPDRVAKATTPDTDLVTVTNRHNPSGRLADRETLADLARVARGDGARLLVDEVYASYVVEADGSGPFGGPTAAGLDGAVVTGSLTKFFGLGDLRIGWIVADEDFVSRARTAARHVPATAGPSRALGMRALHDAEALADRSRELLAENAELLAAFVGERDDVSGYAAPDSAFAFLDPANADGDRLAEAAWENGLLVVPGRFFDDAERVRVSLGGTPREMSAALEQLGAALDGFKN